jgi:hypothetical protein
MCTCVKNISRGEVKNARRDYYCMASDFIRECILANRYDYKLTFTEWRKIIAMREKNWKIPKGEPYIWQFNNQDGEIFTFKANKEMHDICAKYDLYGEFC